MKPLALMLALAVTALAATSAPPTPEQANAALAVLADAPDEGLGQVQADNLSSDLSSADPTMRIAAADRLRTLSLRYARLAYGQLVPLSVSGEWGISIALPDLAAGYDQALAQGRLADWLAGQRPADARYRDLMDLRRAYAAIVASGGWRVLDSQAHPRQTGGHFDMRPSNLAWASGRTGHQLDPSPTIQQMMVDEMMLQATLVESKETGGSAAAPPPFGLSPGRD